MKTLFALISRNRKLFFRDKGMLFSSLITPIILIVLYGTFLANVYKQSFESSLPEFMDVSEKLINGTVASQLAAALLAVSCVTVTFCVNLTMIQDRANGSRKDFNVAPVKKPVIYLVKLFQRLTFPAERLNNLLTADHLVNKSGLLSSRLRLKTKHIIGLLGDKPCNKQ